MEKILTTQAKYLGETDLEKDTKLIYLKFYVELHQKNIYTPEKNHPSFPLKVGTLYNVKIARDFRDPDKSFEDDDVFKFDKVIIISEVL